MFRVCVLWVVVCCVAVGGSVCAATAGQVVLSESFDQADGKLPAGWRAVKGTWRVEQGALMTDSLRGESYVVVGDAAWENYEVEVTATFLKVTNPSRWLSIVFRAAADGQPPFSHFPIRQESTARNGTEFAVKVTWKDWSVRSTGKAKRDCELGKPVRLRLVVRNTRVECFVDGAKVVESPFCIERSAGRVGLGASGCVARFDDLVVRRLPKSAVAKVKEVEHPERSLCVAHRGFSRVYPENTTLAMLKADEAGAEGVECDVYNSKDGVTVLLHDRKVDRTTNGTGKVDELTLAELSKLDAGSWKGKQFAGERVPTLVGMLKALRPTGTKAMIEVKPNGIAKQVVAAIREADMVEQVVAISFSAKACADVRRIEPRIPAALVVGGKPGKTPAERAAILAGRAKACGATILDLQFQMITPELVADLKARGFEVWCWTVNDEMIIDTMARWGVSAITTDRPDLMMAWRRKVAAK